MSRFFAEILVSAAMGALLCLPAQAQVAPLDHLLDVFLRRGRIEPAWIDGAWMSKLALEANSIKLIGVADRPNGELSFIGTGQDAEFRPERAEIYETIETSRQAGVDGPFEITEKLEGNRLWIADLDGVPMKIQQDLTRETARDRQYRPGEERDALAAQQLRQAEAEAGAQDFAQLIDKLRHGFAFYMKPIDGGALLSVSLAPRYDDGDHENDRILRLVLSAVQRTGDPLNWRQHEERFILTCEPDGRIISLTGSKIDSRRDYGEMQPTDADRARFHALIGDYARLLGMKLMLEK